MARGRFVSESIAKDARLNSLSIEGQLLYLMAIPHLDRDGLIDGDPDVLWATICPKRRVFIDAMASFIDEWIAAKLVIRYGCDEGEVLWFCGFNKNQTGLRYDREAPSRFPPPPSGVNPELIRSSDGVGVAQGQEQVEVQVQVKDQVKEEVKAATPATADPSVAMVWESWYANMPSAKSPIVVDSVNDLLSEYSAAEIVEAISIAVKRNKRSLSYVEGILKKGVFNQPPPNGGDYAPGRSTNNGVNAIMDYVKEKGMINERN